MWNEKENENQETGQMKWTHWSSRGPGDLPDPNISGSISQGGSMLLLLLSRFSHVRLCATPEMAAQQAPPSLGFSRQKHLSGLPLLSLWRIHGKKLMLLQDKKVGGQVS